MSTVVDFEVSGARGDAFSPEIPFFEIGVRIREFMLPSKPSILAPRGRTLLSMPVFTAAADVIDVVIRFLLRGVCEIWMVGYSLREGE